MDNDTRLAEIAKELEKLHSCFRGMDLPDYRKSIKTLDNLKWLDKNMVTRNSKHPRFALAKECIRRLIEELTYT